MPVPPEVAIDAGKLLARNGHTVEKVWDVDSEGEDVIIVFVAKGGEAKTAYVSTDGKTEHVEVVARWDV